MHYFAGMLNLSYLLSNHPIDYYLQFCANQMQVA